MSHRLCPWVKLSGMPLKRFSTRTLLLLVAFVAIALGLWVERNNRVAGPGPYQLQIAGDHAEVLDTATGQIAGQKPTQSQGDTSLLDLLEQIKKKAQSLNR